MIAYHYYSVSFKLFRRLSKSNPTVEDALQPGKSLVAAGYALYGSATALVLSTGQGVNGFMLDPVCTVYRFITIECCSQKKFFFIFQAIGEFILTDPKMTVPSRGKIYSINEGYAGTWDDAVKEYVESKKNPKVNNHS